jgi:hypothetical protein
MKENGKYLVEFAEDGSAARDSAQQFGEEKELAFNVFRH